MYDSLKSPPALMQTRVKLMSYGSSVPLLVDGQCLCEVKYNGKGTFGLLFFVVPARSSPLLGFVVETQHDLTAENMKTVIQEFAKRDHSECGCIMLVLNSYGITGSDGKRYVCSTDCIAIKDFEDDFAKNDFLSGKPKIFMYNFCRGPNSHQEDHELDQGDHESNQEDHELDIFHRVIPAGADCLWFYSTISGYVSYWNTFYGSSFFSELERVLERCSYKDDLVRMLTKVTRELANRPTHQQVSEVRSTLTKQLHFMTESDKSSKFYASRFLPCILL